MFLLPIPPIIFPGEGVKKYDINLALIFAPFRLRIWVSLFSKWSNVSEIQTKLLRTNDRPVSSQNLVHKYLTSVWKLETPPVLLYEYFNIWGEKSCLLLLHVYYMVDEKVEEKVWYIFSLGFCEVAEATV